ncbi:TonB protein C-terminal [Chitinophaga sp. YR627]|uniref:energy transducer TonB n=1 Tax=Chitinophaga sp. YR627 TaxID=1881041 RepID=UPI0008F42F48|nr:energy transducer TonB [Chitinophaga sp. YR627]SFM86799.1 TonB protein C-terminal [Chitinophaga sp. YR627]
MKTSVLLLAIGAVFSACFASERRRQDTTNNTSGYNTTVTQQDTSGCTYQYDSTLQQKVYDWVDERPKYASGDEAQLRFFSMNFNYPPDHDEFQGTIRLTYIIDVDGQMRDAKILDKAEADYSPFEKDALRVLSLMPRWKPGCCQGKEVPVRLNWFVHF